MLGDDGVVARHRIEESCLSDYLISGPLVPFGLSWRPKATSCSLAQVLNPAYGNPNILLHLVLGRFREEPGSFRILENNNIYFSRYLSILFPKIDVAAAYQRVLEIRATNYIRHYVQQTGIDTVVLAEGVVANVKMNQRILEIPRGKTSLRLPEYGRWRLWYRRRLFSQR